MSEPFTGPIRWWRKGCLRMANLNLDRAARAEREALLDWTVGSLGYEMRRLIGALSRLKAELWLTLGGRT